LVREVRDSTPQSAFPPRTDPHITPAADASASSTIGDSSNALPESESSNVSNDLSNEEAAKIDDLIQANSAMAARLSDDEGMANPEVAPNGQYSPHAST
ncbi:hypothetical protein FS837_011636, partial [Tulasnella sp. UAMH 9824]